MSTPPTAGIRLRNPGLFSSNASTGECIEHSAKTNHLTKNSQSNRSSGKSMLSATNLQNAFPQHSGTVLKLHIPPLYTFLPHFFQTIILQIWCFKFLRPHWQSRYLILLGSYLYKFTTISSVEPKGCPLAMESIDVHLMDESTIVNDIGRMVPLPIGYTTMICCATFRKKYYYACTSHEEAMAWIHAIRDAQHESVKRSMKQHTPVDSYPTQWNYYDRLGRSIVQRKDRIRKRMEEYRELELTSIVGGGDGGPAPRGYYG